MLTINTNRDYITCSETEGTKIETNQLLFNNFSSEKNEQEENCKILKNEELEKLKKTLFKENILAFNN